MTSVSRRQFVNSVGQLGAWSALYGAQSSSVAQAQSQADGELAFSRNEDLGPLHGLPMSVKEALDAEGLPTTWGDPAFADNIAVEDSAVVSSYRSAGAVLLGKTNVPLGLARYQSFNEIYGQTNNPWNLGHSPGGSSGGSAAALAAGLTALVRLRDMAARHPHEHKL